MTNVERKEWKKIMKHVFKNCVHNPNYKDDSHAPKYIRWWMEDKLEDSLQWCDRRRYDEDGDSWVDYGFRNIGFMTDDEIDEWMEEHEVCHSYSMYDCSGEAVTSTLHWHRNPDNTISVIHHMSIDW